MDVVISTVSAVNVLTHIMGFFGKKVLDFTAKKLKELGHEKCRELIVRELNDIKTKLDALARKDLLSSICSLKEGLCLLNLSLYQRSNDETSFAQDGVLNEALPSMLTEKITELKIASKERFTSSKRAFERSNTEATRAFCNEALSTEDRILATKLRVISRILESLEDPCAAADICNIYLTELHDVPAVKKMFSVYVSGGIKSFFYGNKRLANVVSVTMINVEVLKFTKTFTKVPVYFFNWPMIDLGGSTYHPLFPNKKILREIEKFEVETALITRQNTDIVIPKEICPTNGRIAINSKGEIIAVSTKGNVFKIISSEVQMFCTLPKEDIEVDGIEILPLMTIDEEDNIYLITTSCKLFVFNATGSMEYNSTLEFLKGKLCESELFTINFCTIGVSKDKNIFIYWEQYVYVCDSNAQLKYIFPVQMPFSLFNRENSLHLGISDENEIIVTNSTISTLLEYIVYNVMLPLVNLPRNISGTLISIYTKRGYLKRTFYLPDHLVMGVAFNYATKEVIILSKLNNHSYDFYLLIYSTTGEQRRRYTFSLPCHDPIIISHRPSGPVALIVGNEEPVFYLQK